MSDKLKFSVKTNEYGHVSLERIISDEYKNRLLLIAELANHIGLHFAISVDEAKNLIDIFGETKIRNFLTSGCPLLQENK